MHDCYTSEKLSRELPRPLINFLWYLWETYGNPNESEFRIALQNDSEGILNLFNYELCCNFTHIIIAEGIDIDSNQTPLCGAL